MEEAVQILAKGLRDPSGFRLEVAFQLKACLWGKEEEE